jgi:phosphoglycolate phosphatase-like HAD superfamily hydrolase
VTDAFGTAVVTDFDGTLARLAIPWQSLRESLSVRRIEDLWLDADARRWEPVTRAEVDAALLAAPVPAVVEALGSVPAIAVLTNNDETAVQTFLDRFPDLRSRVCVVVGRQTLRGPKTDFTVFSAGYSACRHALSSGDDSTEITYVGDMDYELDYARRLGAKAIDVRLLAAASRSPGTK